MKVGYIRVSTTVQNVDRQVDALKGAECEKLFIDKITGTKASRPQLDEMFRYLRSGDVIVVTELSRFGRSTKDLFRLIERVEEQGVEFISLKETIDTTSAYGKFFFTINCAFAQLQRDLIVQNTNEGLKAARARGRIGGRPKSNPAIIEKAIKLYNTQTHSLKEIQEITGVSKSTLYNYLKK